MQLRRLRAPTFILAAVWIAGATLYLRYADIRAAKFLRNWAFEICDYVDRRLTAYTTCWSDLTAIAAFLDNAWADLAIFTLAPVLFAWLAVCVVQKLRQSARAPRR